MVRRLASDLQPISEFHTKDYFSQLVATVEAPPGALLGLDQLKTMASAVLLERQPFERMVRVAHRCKRAFNGIRGSQVLPVLRWEVVEHQQCTAIFGEALGGLAYFHS